MKIVFGLADLHIKLWELIPDIEVMINAIKWRWSRPPARKVWVDSGGYQIMVKGLKISIDTIIQRYRELDADIYMSLDIPPRTLCPDDKELVKKNIENYEILRTKLDDKTIVPVVHCYEPNLMLEAIDIYRSLGAKMIAFGGAVPPTMGRMGRGSRLLPLIALAIVVKASKLPVHVLGLGGANTMYTVVKILGASSMDSSAWRIKAAYGKIIVPGLGERYVGNGKARFGKTPLKQEELEMLIKALQETNFPYMDKIHELLNTFPGRAIINAWILHKYRDYVANTNRLKWLIERSNVLKMLSIEELIKNFNSVSAHAVQLNVG